MQVQSQRILERLNIKEQRKKKSLRKGFIGNSVRKQPCINKCISACVKSNGLGRLKEALGCWTLLTCICVAKPGT